MPGYDRESPRPYVAQPPRICPWRLSPLRSSWPARPGISPPVVQWTISMIVMKILWVSSLHDNTISCTPPYCVLLLVSLLLYVIWRLMFIPRFAEIWGPTSMCGSAWALYRALDRPGRLCVHQSITGNRRNCTRQSLVQLLRHGL